jgi:hypothetical protein
MNIGPKGDQTPGAGKLPWKDYSIRKGTNEEDMVTFLDKHDSDWEMEMLLGKADVLVSREPNFEDSVNSGEWIDLKRYSYEVFFEQLLLYRLSRRD